MTTINAIDVIDLLPDEIKALLDSDSYFTDITVVVAERGNIAAEIDRRQAVITAKTGKRGVAVIVLQLEASDPANGHSYGPLELAPSLQIIENVPLNLGAGGTGKSARTIARRIRDILKLHWPRGLVKNFRCADRFLEPVDVGDKNLVGYQVNFLCLEDDNESITKLALPQFSPASGATPQTVTITGPVGASIYYTLDGTHPWSGNAAAVLFSVPVAVTSGPKILRARAFQTGKFPSDTQLSNYT